MEEKTKEIATRAPDDIQMVNGQFLPETFKQAWYMAEIYSKSGMVPKAYTGNPSAIIVAAQLGAQLGLDSLTSLQSIAVVNGMPTVWGDAQKALVMQSGTLEFFVEYYTGNFPEKTFMSICIAKRKGTGQDYDPKIELDDLRKMGLFVNTFSIEDAMTAGLWKKSGTWSTNPKRMLKMRSRAFTLRDGWPDVLKGLHSTEEMEGATVTLVEKHKGHYEAPKVPASQEPVKRAEDEGKLGAGLSKYEPVKPAASENLDDIIEAKPEVVHMGEPLDPAHREPEKPKYMFVPTDAPVDEVTRELKVEDADAELKKEKAALEKAAKTVAEKYQDPKLMAGRQEPKTAAEIVDAKNQEYAEKEATEKAENWWNDDKHWKFRRGLASLTEILKDHFDDFMGAGVKIQTAYKEKFTKSQGADTWFAVMDKLATGKGDDGPMPGAVVNAEFGDDGPMPGVDYPEEATGPNESQDDQAGPSIEEQEEIKRNEILEKIKEFPQDELIAAQTKLGQKVGFQPAGLGSTIALLRALEMKQEPGKPVEDKDPVESPLDQLEKLRLTSEANRAHYEVAITKLGDPQTAEECMAVIHFINQRIAMQAEDSGKY